MSNEPIIKAISLTKKFGSFTAVDRVTFEVHQGQVFGFLGPNGAGKTTTIRMLCGIIKPTSGTAVVAGVDVSRDPERVRAQIGYMSQRFSLYGDLTVAENLDFYGNVYGVPRKRLRERIDTMMHYFDLGEARNVLARDLAGGYRQRLALACALLHEPKVLFLDEPTSGVDPLARRRFWDLIYDLAARGTTVLLTTHYLDEAEYCQRLAFIGAGRLLAVGSPSEIKTKMAGFSVFSVAAEPQDRALARLRALDGVVSAVPFGAEAHVVVSSSVLDEKAIAEALNRAEVLVGYVRKVPPSLEDVFIHLVRAEN